MSLTKLPQELVDQICGYLAERPQQNPPFPGPCELLPDDLYPTSRTTLCNLRLMDLSSFTAGASRELYRFVSVGITVQQFEGLAKLAQRPQDAQWVRFLSLASPFSAASDSSRPIKKIAAVTAELPQILSSFPALRHLILGFGGPLMQPFDLGYVDAWISTLDTVEMELTHLSVYNRGVTQGLVKKLQQLRIQGKTDSVLQKNLSKLRQLTTIGLIARLHDSRDSAVSTDEWLMIAKHCQNLENIMVRNFCLGQHDPLVGKPVSKLSLEAGTIEWLTFCSILDTSSSTLTELSLNAVTVKGVSTDQVYRAIQTRCKVLTSLFLNLQNDLDSHSSTTMTAICGESVGTCWDHPQHIAAHSSLFELVDKNRIDSGLEPKYHPVLTYKKHNVFTMKRAIEAARAKAKSTEK